MRSSRTAISESEAVELFMLGIRNRPMRTSSGTPPVILPDIAAMRMQPCSSLYIYCGCFPFLAACRRIV